MLPKDVHVLFQKDVTDLIEKYEKSLGAIEEIRVRLNQPLECIYKQGYQLLPYEMHENVFKELLDHLFVSSRYRYARELKECFITLPGGHRVGLAGEIIMNGDEIDHLEMITSLNIRIHQLQRLSFNISHRQLFIDSQYASTLIIGPPNAGKTSLLRKLVQSISQDVSPFSKKICVIDERNEIMPPLLSKPNTCTRVDHLSGCPKHLAIPLMIRSMSPDIIIVDEIATNQDVTALLDGMKSGISLICTAHASSYQELASRMFFKVLLSEQLFDRVIVLSSQKKGELQLINLKESV